MSAEAEQAIRHTKDLVQLLAHNQAEVAAILNFVQPNKTQVRGFFEFLTDNPDGFSRLLEQSTNTRSRNDLVRQFPDRSAEKAALEFMFNHPVEMNTLFSFLHRNRSQLIALSGFAGNHAPELTRMTRFVAAHPEEMKAIIDLSAKTPDGSISITDLIKNPRLGFFAMRNLGELRFISKFSSQHEKELDSIFWGVEPRDVEQLHAIAGFLEKNKGQLPNFIQASTGLQEKLAPQIVAKQREIEKVRHAEAVAAEARLRAQLQQGCPEPYVRLLELDNTARVMNARPVRPSQGERNSLTQKYLAVIMEMKKAGCLSPDY